MANLILSILCQDQLLYLTVDAAASFVSSITHNSDGILADHSYLIQFLADTLNKGTTTYNKSAIANKENLLAYLLSHVVSLPYLSAQEALLQILSAVYSPVKL